MGPFDCVYGVIICGMDSGTEVDVQLRWGIIKMIMKMDRREQHNAENYDQSHMYRTFHAVLLLHAHSAASFVLWALCTQQKQQKTLLSSNNNNNNKNHK